MLSHRSVHLKAVVWSNWTANAELEASTTFEQTHHHGVGVDSVHPQAGHIDLGQMSGKAHEFTDHVLIEIELAAHMTDSTGQPVKARWAKAGEGCNPAVAKHGFCWFTAECGDGVPIPVPHVTAERVSDHTVRIHDDRPIGSSMYIYNLGLVVELPTGPRFLTIDPVVTGKGIGS